jgi:metal-responsive CopG/Arc/MetJ family transcriptional regulator
MPEALLERIERFADEYTYSGRSGVVPEGRTLLDGFQRGGIDSNSCTSPVTAVFDSGQSAMQQQLTRIRHENDSNIAGTTHAHRSCVLY